MNLILAFAFFSPLFTDTIDRDFVIEFDSDLTVRALEPGRIEVQHILIGLKPGRSWLGYFLRNNARPASDSETLARHLFSQIKANPSLMRDSVWLRDNGLFQSYYKLVNFGVEKKGDEIYRAEVGSAFADQAFRLRLGELSFVEYSKSNSPYGYHILWRIR